APGAAGRSARRGRGSQRRRRSSPSSPFSPSRPSCPSILQEVDQFLRRDGTVTAIERGSNQLPTDRTINPDADPKPAPVRRRDDARIPAQQASRFAARKPECNRRPAADHLERAEHLFPGPETRVSPGCLLRCLRVVETEPAYACEDRPFEGVPSSHLTTAVSSASSSSAVSLIPSSP